MAFDSPLHLHKLLGNTELIVRFQDIARTKGLSLVC